MFENDQTVLRGLVAAYDAEALAGFNLARGIEAYEQARIEDRVCLEDLRTLERLKVAQQQARELRSRRVWDYLEYKTRELKAQLQPVAR